VSIEQSAGRFEAEAYTGGWPLLATITDKRFDLEILNLKIDDLHDLKHVVERMIVSMEVVERK